MCSNCFFDVDESERFFIESIVPSEVNPGDDIFIFGTFGHVSLSDFIDIKLGNFRCAIDILDYSEFTGELNERHFFKCKLPLSIPAGYYRLSVTKAPNRIKNTPSRASSSYTSALSRFDVNVLPSLLALNASKVSPNGFMLEVSGRGFMRDPFTPIATISDSFTFTATISDSSCDLSTVNGFVKECLFVPDNVVKNTIMIFPGGTGLREEIAYVSNLNLTEILEQIHVTSISKFSDSRTVNVADFVEVSQTGFSKRLSSLFCPMHSGEYTFFYQGLAPQMAYMSLSPMDATTKFSLGLLEPLCLVLSDNNHFTEFLFTPECTRNLLANECYFFELYFQSNSEAEVFELGMAFQGPPGNPRVEYPHESIFMVSTDFSKEFDTYLISIESSKPVSFDLTITESDSNNPNVKKNYTIEDIKLNEGPEVLEKRIFEKTSRTFKIEKSSEAKNSNLSRYTLTIIDDDGADFILNISLAKNSLSNESVSISKTQARNLGIEGSFSLNIDGSKSDLISFGETSESVTAKLQKISALRNQLVVYTFFTVKQRYAIMVKHQGQPLSVKRDQSTLRTKDSQTDVALIITAEQLSFENQVFYDSVPSEFFQTWHTKPQVVVERNGKRATCPKNNCSLEYYKDAEMPRVTSFDIKNNRLSIQIENLTDPFKDALFQDYNLMVYYKNVACLEPKYIDLIIRCNLSIDSNSALMEEAGLVDSVQVHLLGFGIFGNTMNQNPTDLVVEMISPSIVGTGGGCFVNVFGRGFKTSRHNTTVLVGNRAAQITYEDYNSLMLILPKASNTNTVGNQFDLSIIIKDKKHEF